MRPQGAVPSGQARRCGGAHEGVGFFSGSFVDGVGIIGTMREKVVGVGEWGWGVWWVSRS